MKLRPVRVAQNGRPELWGCALGGAALAAVLLASACNNSKSDTPSAPATNNNDGTNNGDGSGDLAIQVNGVNWDGNSDLNSRMYRVLGN